MPLTPEQKAQLAGAAGQSRERGPSIDAKIIRFAGDTGELRTREKDGTIIPISIPSEFIILKKRNMLGGHINEEAHFTSEYDFKSTIVSLFKTVNGKTQHVASGTPPQLRAQFPNLKSRQMCYALHNGEIVKLEIKGASYTSFIDFSDKLREEGLHSYEVVTIVSGVGSGKKGVVNYKFMEFDKRDLTDEEFATVAKELESLTKRLYEIDRHYAEKRAEKAGVADGVDPEPVSELAAVFDEEINPEDIPF